MPHYVSGSSNDKNHFLEKDEFANVVNLDSNYVCCDENAGSNVKPMLLPYSEWAVRCNTFWCMRGFTPKKGKKSKDDIAQLKPYNLM